MHELERRGLEVRQRGVGEPFPIHIGPELHLVGFLAVGGPCGRSDLGVLLPAGIVGERDCGFDFVREREEAGRPSESLVDGGDWDAVVSDAEETDFFCCGAELLCDFVDARVEVRERDGGNGPVQVLGRRHGSHRNEIRGKSVDEEDTNVSMC